MMFSFSPQQTQQMADSYKQRMDSGQNLMTRGPESLAYQHVYGGQPAAKPGQAQSQQSPYATSTPYAAYNPNIANNPQAPRPPAFQASYGQPDGSFSSQPNFGQRDAFIQNLNQQAGMQAGGMPQFNFGQAWNQAGNMVQQGWQNPFAPQSPFAGQMAVPGGMADPGQQIRELLPQVADSTQTPSGLYDQYQQERAGQQAQQGREQAMRELYFLTGQRQTPTVQSDFSADKVQRWMNQERQSSNWEYDNQSQYYPDKVGGRGLTNRLFDFLDRAPAATGNATVDARQREGFARQAGDALQQAVAAGTIGQQEAAAISRWYATGGQEGESPADARRRVEYSQWLESRGMSPTEAAEASRGQYAVPELSPGGPASGGYLDWHIQQGQQAMTRRAEQERAVNQEKVRASWNSPEYLERRLKELQQDLTDTNRGKAVPGVPRTAAQIQKEIQQAQQALRDSKAKESPATAQWNRIKATTNTQTKPLSPAHQRVYQAMVAEQMKSRGMGDTWAATGSPLANMARARNAKTGQGITGMEPRKR